MVSWAERMIWWHVYPLGFTGAEKTELPADGRVRHRLRQLEAWLGYAADLGCTGLLTVAETPGPDAWPGDPALVPAHSWLILGS